MKKSSSIFFLFIILFIAGISSCEKDDLCDPNLSATPRLIITFVDIAAPEDRKTVDELSLREIGSTEFAPLDDTGSTLLIDIDSIAIPLRTDNLTTSYDFIKNDEDGINIDNVDFNYTLSDQYINRACGFKVNYNDLGAILNLESGNGNWIRGVQVITDAVTSNNDIHIEIRH